MFVKEPVHELNIFVRQEDNRYKAPASRLKPLERSVEKTNQPTLDPENVTEGIPSIGRQLLSKLLGTAKELQGRVVGRNNDDACILLNGLEILSREWNSMEHDLQLLQGTVRDENSPPEANHILNHQHRSPAQQSRSYKEAVAQARRLEEELDEIKVKWEHALSSTVDQQVAVHRQRLRDRESLIAQQEAEISQLRTSQKAQNADAQRSSSVGRQGKASPRYMMSGRVEVGQTLQIEAVREGSIDDNAYQWYRVLQAEEWVAISGAIRRQYSPEPFDCGCLIGCYVLPHNSSSNKAGFKVVSPEPVGISKAFLEWVGKMYDEGQAIFEVVVMQRNGMLHTNREVCTLEVNRQHVILQQRENGNIQQSYSSGMQVCGARGHGTVAAQGVFLSLRGQEVYMLACKTAKERNACILLIRKMAALHGLDLRGPE